MFTTAGNRCARAFRISCLAISTMMFAVSATGDYAYANEVAAAAGMSKLAKPPGNSARAASLADVSSGRILFSQRGDEPMKIASLTKIMTAIVAIENGNMESTLKVSAEAAGKEGSSIYLKAGEKMTLRNALYGLMLRSGNDAATAIAEHVGGSVEGFVYLMNKKADEIGLAHSHFMNPSGLDEQSHYSSANDLAKLTVYALHNPDFKEIVKTRVKKVPSSNDPWDYEWVNKNRMLTMYEGADGVKTGYTKQALRTLVSSATRGGQQLVAVTLNDRDDWIDHRNLLDYGFARYPLASVAKVGDPIAGYPYEVSKGFTYPFAEGERERLVISLTPLREGTTEYKLGYRGQLRFLLDGEQIGAVPFVDDPSRRQSKQELQNMREEHEAGMTGASPSAVHSSFFSSFKSVMKALFMEGGAS